MGFLQFNNLYIYIAFLNDFGDLQFHKTQSYLHLYSAELKSSYGFFSLFCTYFSNLYHVLEESAFCLKIIYFIF